MIIVDKTISFIEILQLKVENANIFFAEKLKQNFETKGILKEQYIRYLQMQYHLTQGVQATFLTIAGHPQTRNYKQLRKFLIQFGYEEEMHFKLAEKDLKNTGGEIGEVPFPVDLWWAYQKKVVECRPMERLGATAVLENVGNYSAPLIKKLLGDADFIDKKNTTFTQVHMHEELPHGDQILDALGSEKFSKEHEQQILEGADKATWLYASTIYDWIINGSLSLVY